MDAPRCTDIFPEGQPIAGHLLSQSDDLFFASAKFSLHLTRQIEADVHNQSVQRPLR